LHKDYPGNKDVLAAKTGRPADYATPTEIPGLTDKPKRANVRQNCIHCHMVKEFAMRAKWEAGKLTGEDLWVYPMPQRIGLTLDVQDGLVVESVREDSPAALAGIARGDRLASLGGQPLVSTADVQWVLHHAPADARLAAVVERGDQRQDKTIVLSGDWKKSDIGWRASSWYGLRQGVKFDPLPAAERKNRGIDDGQMALVVARMYARGAQKMQEAGVKANDVIVAVDGRSDLTTETDFLAWLRLTHGPDDSVKFTVLRGRERKELVVPLW
jgi:S1-C subfamily serine protease